MTIDPKAGTALVVPDEGGPLQFGRLDQQFYSTLTDPKDRGKVVALMQGKATPIAECIGKTITVSDILAHGVETVDEKTGEIRGLLRIVLANGAEAWQSTSSGVRDSIRLLAKFYGKPPWNPALKLKVEQISTRRGFRTFILSPVA